MMLTVHRATLLQPFYLRANQAFKASGKVVSTGGVMQSGSQFDALTVL